MTDTIPLFLAADFARHDKWQPKQNQFPDRRRTTQSVALRQ
jgi:hypothetical protein